MQRCLLKNTNHNPDPSAYNSLGRKRNTAKTCDDRKYAVHFLSRVSPEAQRYDAKKGREKEPTRLSIAEIQGKNLPSSPLEGGFLYGEAEMKQKIKKLRADKRPTLCYTIKAISYRF